MGEEIKHYIYVSYNISEFRWQLEIPCFIVLLVPLYFILYVRRRESESLEVGQVFNLQYQMFLYLANFSLAFKILM